MPIGQVPCDLVIIICAAPLRGQGHDHMALALVQRFDMDVALLGHQCTYRIIGIYAGYRLRGQRRFMNI
ncbi:hypothetical protein AO259_13055 [Pseudomonas sp. ICMP 564]|nr:hypothetical protein AO259_13055 [Pseudomonas sp. ICMP 564]